MSEVPEVYVFQARRVHTVLPNAKYVKVKVTLIKKGQEIPGDRYNNGICFTWAEDEPVFVYTAYNKTTHRTEKMGQFEASEAYKQPHHGLGLWVGKHQLDITEQELREIYDWAILRLMQESQQTLKKIPAAIVSNFDNGDDRYFR